jgi:integrase
MVTVSEVRPGDVRRFLADEATRRRAPSSQARTVAALKCFFRFLLENEQIERDPALGCGRESLPDVLDKRELVRLLDATEPADVWFFAYAGLRRRELLGLDWQDVDLGRRLLKVRRAKSGRAADRANPPAPEPL